MGRKLQKQTFSSNIKNTFPITMALKTKDRTRNYHFIRGLGILTLFTLRTPLAAWRSLWRLRIFFQLHKIKYTGLQKKTITLKHSDQNKEQMCGAKI